VFLLAVLVTIETVALLIGVPLLLLYLRERVKNLAREASERVIAGHRHELAEVLEASKAELRRRGEESNLYARERHRAYPQIYRRYRIAADLFIQLLKASRGDAEEFEKRKQAALRALRLAKNAEILSDLYLSDAVRDHLNEARTSVAAFSVEATNRVINSPIEPIMEKENRMDMAMLALRNAMRDELRTATDSERPKY